jgi:copper homeostasis protein
MPPLVEVCVESAASAIAAQNGGADRVELCVNRAVGGVTPPETEIEKACAGLRIPVHVLIRPRASDFAYSNSEYELMRAQILRAKSLGAAGVVLGLLRADNSIDLARTAALVTLARPLTVTFHKAFDEAHDPFSSLDLLISLGVERVLTSGQAPTAHAGVDLLSSLVRRASGRIVILAGGSITLNDLPSLRAAGLDEIHAGSCVAPDGPTEGERVRSLADAWRGVCRLD